MQNILRLTRVFLGLMVSGAVLAGSGVAIAGYEPLDPGGVAYVDIDSLAHALDPRPLQRLTPSFPAEVRSAIEAELDRRLAPEELLEKLRKTIKANNDTT